MAGQTTIAIGRAKPAHLPPQHPSRAHATVKADRLELDDKIQFTLNQADILPQSNALLDDAAKEIKEHPEITSIEIQGHSSSEGNSESSCSEQALEELPISNEDDSTTWRRRERSSMTGRRST